MPSNTPFLFIFTDQNVTIRNTFLLNIAIPVIQKRYFVRQLSMVTSRSFRNLTKLQRPTNERRYSAVPHGTYPAPSVNIVSEKPNINSNPLNVTYSYRCVYVFLMFVCSVLYTVFIVPTGILRLPWRRLFRVFPSVVRQMPGYTSQRRGTVRILPSSWIVLFYVLFVSIVLFYVLLVCKCVLYYYHRVATQLKLIISNIISH
jgi:hypothetical protein